MDPGKYRLYGRPGSGSVIVQMLLEEIAAPYERIWVGTTAPELEAYRRIAPTGRVPALVLPDGTPMFESAAMCIHLAIAHPQARLAPPPGSAAHARFLQWMVYLSANLYECALRIYYSDRFSSDPAAADGIRRRGTEDYVRFFGLIGAALDPFVLGSEPCAADHYLHVLAGWHPDGRAVLESAYPALAHHGSLMSARPAVRRAEADNAT